MKKILQILIVLITSIHAFSQDIEVSIAGEYANELGGVTITKIDLRDNGTFYLKTVDPVFTNRHQMFENEGHWILKNDTVLLNPELSPLKLDVALNEKQIDLTDSVQISVKYYVDYYQLDSVVERKEREFDLMTIYTNKRKKYVNLVRYEHQKKCGFSRKIKNQIQVDSTNTFKIIRKDLDKIGVLTYGLGHIEWLEVSDKNSNAFDITIIQQVDINRTPRCRALLVDKDKIYFYRRDGKIKKSLSPLNRKTNHKSN